MGLRERFLKQKAKKYEPVSPAPENPVPTEQKQSDPTGPDPYQELKSRIHRKLIESIDLTTVDPSEDAPLVAEIRHILSRMIETEDIFLTTVERERLIEEVQYETFGLGPLEPLLHDPQISDILVNGHKRVYLERFGRLERANVIFRDDAHLMQIIDRIVSKVGRRIDESSPMVDARLPDGSRVNAIIPPVALDGPMLSIRR